MAKRARTCKKIYLSLNNGSVLLYMLWTYLTYAFIVKGIWLVKRLIIKFDQSVTRLLLLKEGLTRTLLVLIFVFLCIKSTESPCSARHHTLSSLPCHQMQEILLSILLLIINWCMVSSVQYFNHEVNIMYIAMNHWQKIQIALWK